MYMSPIDSLKFGNPYASQVGMTHGAGIPSGGQTQGIGVSGQNGQGFNWRNLDKFDGSGKVPFLSATSQGLAPKPEKTQAEGLGASGGIEKFTTVPKDLASATKQYETQVQLLGADANDPNAKYKTAQVGQNLCLVR